MALRYLWGEKRKKLPATFFNEGKPFVQLTNWWNKRNERVSYEPRKKRKRKKNKAFNHIKGRKFYHFLKKRQRRRFWGFLRRGEERPMAGFLDLRVSKGGGKKEKRQKCILVLAERGERKGRRADWAGGDGHSSGRGGEEKKKKACQGIPFPKTARKTPTGPVFGKRRGFEVQEC